MADDKTKTDQKPDEKTNSGTVSPESTGTADTALAAKAGITEGEVHALRDDAGLNQGAGHTSDLHAWSLTEAGKKFAKDEGERNKAEAEKAKAYKEKASKSGLTEAEAKYVEATKN